MSAKNLRAPRFDERIPEGDDRERSVCAHCGWVDYRNPKIVVGSVAIWKTKILLCRRAIEPRKGFWTLPAGYLELGESAEDGARREAREEAGARLAIERLLAVYSVPRISQVQLMYLARLEDPEIAAGVESLEVALFSEAKIPWAELAFPTVGWALRHYFEARETGRLAPFANPVEGL